MGMLDDYLDSDRWLYNHEEPDHVSDAWAALNAFCGLDESNRDEAKVQRCVYKYNDCGAWVQFSEYGITFGSIVEGSDIDCASYFIPWRAVTAGSISERLDAIEKEADLIWQWANEVREDGKTDAESGIDCPDIAWDFRHLNNISK